MESFSAPQFRTERAPDFSLNQIRRSARVGDELIRESRNLHISIRSVQEWEMGAHPHWAQQTQTHLTHEPELRNDIMELHRPDAITRYRAPSPGSLRVSGLPRNVADREFTRNNLCFDCARRGEMFSFAGAGFLPVDGFFCSPPTSVAKKLPDRTAFAGMSFGADGESVLGVQKRIIGFAIPRPLLNSRNDTVAHQPST